MQTFLPYPDDRASAAVLDDKRLGKQRVETLQILRALTWHTYGWRNHPAVRMWRGFVPALVAYGAAVCDEWVSRGRADAVKPVLLEFTGGVEPSWDLLHESGQRPPWLGLEALHVSHQSALVRKEPEHYRPFFPDVPDDLPYLWPPSAFPRWPLRRGHPDALPVQAAVELLGLEELSAEQRTALDELLAGRSTELASSDRDALTATGLVAGMATPGSTLWLVPGEEPPVPGLAPPVPETPLEGSAVSPSIARPPQPEDVERVAAEVAAAAAEPEFRFLRLSQLDRRRPTDGVGLAVVDPGVEDAPDLDLPTLRLHQLPPEPEPEAPPRRRRAPRGAGDAVT